MNAAYIPARPRCFRAGNSFELRARRRFNLAAISERNQPFTGKGERAAVWLLCLLAAVHVFVFSAAFPFFSVVDEQVHFDLAVRYSSGPTPALTHAAGRRGAVPSSLPFSARRDFCRHPLPSQAGSTHAPPPWKQPAEAVRDQLLAKEAGYREILARTTKPPRHRFTMPSRARGGGWES